MVALAVPSFAFGQGFNAKTPADVARNRAVAQAMLLQGTQPKSLGTGLSAVGEAIIARLANDRADQAQTAGQAHAADVLKTLTSGAPSQGDLVSAMSDPWVANNPGESAVAQTLYSRELQKSDPVYQLDLATKKAQLGLTEAKINGGFYGDSDTAAAQRIVMSGDPASKQYAIAYNELYGGKTQTQQTPDGLVTFQVQNPPPAGVAPPTYGGNDVPAPGAAPADPASAQPSIPGPDGQPLPVAPASATPAAAAAPAATAPQTPAQMSMVGAPASGAVTGAIPNTKPAPNESINRLTYLANSAVPDLKRVIDNFPALSNQLDQLWSKDPTGLANALKDPEYQRAEKAVRGAMGNILYFVSGAAQGDKETEKKLDGYMPKWGDHAPAIADELDRFANDVYGMAVQSQNADTIAWAKQALAGLQGTRDKILASEKGADNSGVSPEGTVITNGSQHMIKRGGKWEPYT